MSRKTARQKPSSEWLIKTFEVRLPKRIFRYLTKISKRTTLSESDLVGNGIIDIVTKYPKITGIKKVGKRWKL